MIVISRHLAFASVYMLATVCAWAGPLIVFNDNGAWCWYQDERVIIHNGKLIIGSVADSSGTGGAARDGNIEVVAYDIVAGGPAIRTVLHANLQGDDHDTAAFLPLPDNRILAMYARHLSDALIRYRISVNPNDTTSWTPEVQLTRNASVTYSNVYRLSAENGGNGRIYDFYRGENFNPNFIVSNDNGQTWSSNTWLIRKDQHRPYPRYTSNNVDRIHFITTEAHPRDYSNSIYYACLYQGRLYAADGTLLHDLSTGPTAPESLTKLYQGGVSNVAWTTGIRLDANGYPYVAFSVQMNQDMNDLRYWYARWDGAKWHVNEMAYAGTALYAAEADYSGLVALDPHNPDVVYISADVHPVTGQALISSADGLRHYELFRGTTSDMGANWSWEWITRNSTVDNIRPIVPQWDGRTVLLWLRGTYWSYTNYDMDVVGMFDPEPIVSNEPLITQQPQLANVRPGGTARLTIKAESPLPMTYQWYKVVYGGTDIEVGDGTNALTLPSVQESDQGPYYCIVTNSAGMAQSLNANITIMELLMHLPLDNTYSDSTGNGYNATAVGNPAFAAGKYNQCLNFDGNDHLNIQNGSNLHLYNGGTVSVWVKTNYLPVAWATLAGKGRFSWRLCQNNNYGSAAFHFNSANGEFQANGDMPVLDNSWHLLTATYDGQKLSLYVDGQLDQATSISEPVRTTTDPVYIANRSDAPRYWFGLVDDVRIYSYALDERTIDSLFNGFACYQVSPFDLNGDCFVDILDIMLFSEGWLTEGQ